MRILFFTLGNELVASSRTRVFQYLPHLVKLGAAVTIIRYQTGADYWWGARVVPKGPVSRLSYLAGIVAIRCYHFFSRQAAFRRLVTDAARYDVVFIQKVIPPADVLDALSKSGIPIVFDFDDAIYANDFYDVEGIRRIIRFARLVVLENEETESFVQECGATKTLRITGPIDCLRYRPVAKREEGLVTIGWVGSGPTTSYLKEIAAPMQRLCARHPHIRMRLIGAGHTELPGVPLERHTWAIDTEPALLADCDIGLMPLPDTTWTQGKGGYKLLQYMAAGLPSVCSPVGVNAEIVIDGVTGYHATSPQQWYERLNFLVTDPLARRVMGEVARQRAEEIYSFETNAPRLFEALREVIDTY